MCFWEEANFGDMLVLWPGVFQVGGVYLLHWFKLQYKTPPVLSTTGYKTRMPRLCLVAWGPLLPLVLCIQCKPVCICAPSHTRPLHLSSFFPLCLSVSLSFCVWNLHNVFQPTRLIIHVLLTSPMSFVLSEICLFCSFFGFMFPSAYPKSVNVLFVLP